MISSATFRNIEDVLGADTIAEVRTEVLPGRKLADAAFSLRGVWNPEALVATAGTFYPITAKALRQLNHYFIEIAWASHGRAVRRKCKVTWGRPAWDLPWAPSAIGKDLADFRTTRKRPGAQARIGWLVGTWGLGSIIAMLAKEAKERGYPKTYDRLERALDAEIDEECAREEAEDGKA
jgi:hypothetical protein